MLKRTSAMLFAVSSITATAFGATITYSVAQKICDYGSNGKILGCTIIFKCVATAALGNRPSSLDIAVRAPMAAEVDLTVSDVAGGMLSVGGTSVIMARKHCPCNVDVLHPSPDGYEWFLFESNPLPSPNGDGELLFLVRFNLARSASQKTAVWLSDDS